jgi:hypothetical protein
LILKFTHAFFLITKQEKVLLIIPYLQGKSAFREALYSVKERIPGAAFKMASQVLHLRPESKHLKRGSARKLIRDKTENDDISKIMGYEVQR